MNLAREVLEALVVHHELVAWVKRNYVSTASDRDKVLLNEVADHAALAFDRIRSAALAVAVRRAMRDAGFKREGTKARRIRFHGVKRVQG